MSRNSGGYSVRKVKSFIGNEGHGFNAELCRDGNPVAFVIDDAGGGMFHWEWKDRSEEAKLLAYVASLPKESWEYSKEPQSVTDEIFVAGLVDDYENDKRFRRICKGKTLFRIKGDKEGEYRTVTSAYDSRVKAWIVAKYGDAVTEILNEKYGTIAA